ncbi:MAG: SSU ribosomal protein S1p [Candidatus Saccharicenans subterraneus]|uniref:Small ribosomal subunit protein bS1 n=1 Tax=Candidatus Saccharicenans subterraneus TaxID=2508984 RepID=A0A3E2BK73_9BACT|nr:MAG: SSU ribosomal protein S1p [Candidatus Saccharicenans subterraneum]
MIDTKKNPKNDDQLTPEDYERLLDQYHLSEQELSAGTIVRGRVVKKTPSHLLLDIGHKTEGAIPLEDFRTPQEFEEIKVGTEIEAILERSRPQDGYFILSKKKADALRALEHLEKAYHSNNWVTGTIKARTRNGYTVDVGLDAFLPESHADLRPLKDPDSLLGQTLKFKVMKFNRKEENVVLSRKLLLQDEREKRKRRVFGRLVKGGTVKGTVKSLTSFGAFIDLGGVEGLLHISDLSWGKVNHPSEVLQVGQEVEVVVLDFNENEEKISLGYKQLTPDPWLSVEQKYQPGTRITGKVVSLTDFGAFVELEKGVEGLVHVSDLTWSKKMVHPKKVLQVGQEVTVQVLEVNPENRRISLGLKQVTPHPLELFAQKHNPGSRLKGKITSLTDFGAFVQVDKDIEGLVHISDISWEKVRHPSDKLKVGEEIEVVLLNVDLEKQKVSLGIKQLEGDIWEDFFQRQKVGDVLKVKIVRIAEFGVFVEIMPGIEGVVFNSELDDNRVENPAEVFKIGEEKMAKIIKLNPAARKISLSFRQAQVDQQKKEFQKYLEGQSDRLTLGDLLREQLKNLPGRTNGKKEGES